MDATFPHLRKCARGVSASVDWCEREPLHRHGANMGQRHNQSTMNCVFGSRRARGTLTSRHARGIEPTLFCATRSVRQGWLEQTARRGGFDAPVAVIWRAPDGDNRLVEHELVALHGELVCTRNEVDRVVVREYLRDIRAEEEACAPR